MKRPEQHVIDAAGGRQLRAVFEPLGWTVNKVVQDYGVDFEVEVFRNGRTTGVTFKVQLKSSEATRYSSNGDFVSQTIDSGSATYLWRELNAPVLLIHADVNLGKTFWTAPQLDASILAKLGDEPPTETVTLRIPTANNLPASLHGMLQAVEQVATLLASRTVVESRVLDFVASVRGRLDSDKLVREFKIKGDSVKLSQAQELLGRGLIDEARKKVNSVLDDAESSIGNKFPAIQILNAIESRAFREGSSTFKAFPEIETYIAGRLWTLTRDGPSYLKFDALISKHAAQLMVAADRETTLYVNWVAHTETTDILWKLSLVSRRVNATRRIIGKYNQCLRLAKYASSSSHRWVLAEPLLRIVSAVSVFITRLRLESLEQSVAVYSGTALEVCKLSAQIASESKDDPALSEAVLAAPMIDSTEGSAALKWARETLVLLQDKDLRETTKDRLEWTAAELRKEPPATAPSFKDLERIFREMASALGIDLSNRNDPRAELVRIGIADLDPSRVLKNCEHIFISLGERTLLGERLKLHTAGNKIIHCDLHRHFIEGLDLDATYAIFKGKYCDTCPDCSPRPKSWEYSEEWQQQENQKHAGFLEEFERSKNRGIP